MVARIVWYKIVHVGDFILSLLRLYLVFFRTFIYGSFHRFYTNSHKWLILFHGSFLNFGANSYKLIHTINLQIIVWIRTRGGFCTNSDNFYTNCIVRIHTICLRKPRGINYLGIRNDPLAFLYEFVSRIGIKVPSAKTSKSEKIGLPHLPSYVGTCTIMYQTILATIRKSRLYDLTPMAYSQPLKGYVNFQPTTQVHKKREILRRIF